MENDSIKEWKTLKTANFKSVEEVCNLAYQYSLSFIIIGFPGAGKSNTFGFVRAALDDVLYLKLNKTFRPKDVFIELLKLLDVFDYDYSLPLKFLADKVVEELNKRSKKSLIIIDEANRLTHSSLTYLHHIIDDATQTGIVISGTPEFELDFEKWLRNSKPGISELNSRIVDRRKLERPMPHEIKAVAEKNGVKDRAELERLAKECKDFRKLYQEVILLRIKAAGKNTPLPKDETDEVVAAT